MKKSRYNNGVYVLQESTRFTLEDKFTFSLFNDVDLPLSILRSLKLNLITRLTSLCFYTRINKRRGIFSKYVQKGGDIVVLQVLFLLQYAMEMIIVQLVVFSFNVQQRF